MRLSLIRLSLCLLHPVISVPLLILALLSLNFHKSCKQFRTLVLSRSLVTSLNDSLLVLMLRKSSRLILQWALYLTSIYITLILRH